MAKKHQPGCPCCDPCAVLYSPSSCMNWTSSAFNDFELDVTGMSNDDCTSGECADFNTTHSCTTIDRNGVTRPCIFSKYASSVEACGNFWLPYVYVGNSGDTGQSLLYPEAGGSADEYTVHAGFIRNVAFETTVIMRAAVTLTPSVLADWCAGSDIVLGTVESADGAGNSPATAHSTPFECDFSSATFTVRNVV